MLPLPPLTPPLAAFPDLLTRTLTGRPTPDHHWKPTPDAWSITEIIGHLLDSERDDFPVRIRLTLDDPTRPWPSIDPERAVRERGHAQADAHELCAAFAVERARSLAWLETLEAPAWGNAHQHAQLGTLRAGDLLAAWVTHDALHLRQLARRHFQLARRDTPGFSSDYAGRWPADG